jgi:hypothetical protein
MADSRSELVPPYFTWLSAHPRLVPYVQIVTPADLPKQPNFAQFRQQSHSQTLSEIIAFQDRHFKCFVPDYSAVVRLAPSDRRLKPEFRMQYRQLCFLEYEIYCRRNDQYLQVNGLLDDARLLYLNIDLIPPHFLVQIDTEKLFADVIREPTELARVKKKFLALYQDYKKSLGTSPTLDQQKKRMKYVINEVLKSVDVEISFFPPTPVQYVFERLLFLPGSCCIQQLNSLIAAFPTSSPNDFMDGLIGIAESLVRQFDIRDPVNFSIIMTMLVRIVFDEVYSTVQVFLGEIEFPDILADMRDATVAELQPPLEYCPPMTDTDRPGLVMREEPNFRRVIDQLELVAFYTNPLDILHQFHLALKEVEKAAHANLRKDCEVALMLPFDVTFGLLLCALAGASIPEYLRVAEFTVRYAPSGKLCPAFDFALTKIRATATHLTQLAAENQAAKEQQQVSE